MLTPNRFTMVSPGMAPSINLAYPSYQSCCSSSHTTVVGLMATIEGVTTRLLFIICTIHLTLVIPYTVVLILI